MNQRRVLILVLAVIVAYFAWSRGGDLIATGSALVGGAGSSARRSVVRADVDRLRADLLERESGVFHPGRDLFRFGVAPAKQRSTPPPRPAPPPKPQAQVDKVETTPVQPPARRPPPVDFAYLGSFGPQGNRIAVFTDQETIYNARVGEVIVDVFLLANIGFESVDIEFVGFPDAETQRLAVGGP
jgi:hypothetical protein